MTVRRSPGPASDPVQAARDHARRHTPKRFYNDATVVEADQAVKPAFQLRLDGRPAYSPGRNLLAVPDRALAEAMAREWQAQGERIEPATMPVTRLVNTALDGVSIAKEGVRNEILQYAGTDLLCYRAGEPEKLAARQRHLWDPVLQWAEAKLDCRFALAEGVIHVEQPSEALEAIGERLALIDDPYFLTGLALATNLTGSALLALAVAEKQLSPHEAWQAAHVDEDWNILQWGEDAEAAARRQHRYRDFVAAALAMGCDDPL